MNYEKALEYATKMHATTPPREGTGAAYITHPVAVAEILREKGFGIDLQIMGLFHDLLEDTKATKEKIVEYGNEEIYEVVVLLTKTDKDTEKYIERISENIKASAVKIADRIHNLRDSVYHPNWDWKLRYYKESDEYYRKLAVMDFETLGVRGQVFLEDFNEALKNLGEHLNSIIYLDFKGPYSFIEEENSVFDCEFKDSGGVYLWTVKTEQGYMIDYIGETYSLAKRQREHLLSQLSLDYGVFDASELKKGNLKMLWNGLWRDKSSENIKKMVEIYPKLADKVIENLKVIDIFFAKTDDDSELRKAIEGEIGMTLREKYPEYKKIYPDDNWIRRPKNKLDKDVVISSSSEILGLDSYYRI